MTRFEEFCTQRRGNVAFAGCVLLCMRKAALSIFTVLLLCIVADRARLLLKGADAFNATGEKQWYDFAHRRDDLAGLFSSVAAPQNQPVIVFVPPQPRDAGWWSIMTVYYMPQSDIASVQICDACPPTSKPFVHAP